MNKEQPFRHGSLFSGIGGFDLAAELMGWDNVFHCEWNEFGQKILKYYWPKAITYEDITTTDFTIHRGRIEILTGGFPCQPYSTAGKRLGKEDDRHLWPEMLRAIREIQPKWIVGENVLGLTNWNDGLVFEEVQVDLENEGYEVQPFILPACAVNAPHRRDRVWFVASNTNGTKQTNNARENTGETGNIRRKEESNVSGQLFSAGTTSNTNSQRQQERNITSKSSKQEQLVRSFLRNEGFGNFPTQSPICTGDDGFPPRLDRITFSKWRNESLKAAGNAIVPQVALQIFKAIELYENQKK